MGASDTAAGADSPSGVFPPHGSHSPPSASRRSSEEVAAARRADEQEAQSVASEANWEAREEAADSVRAAWSLTASKPDSEGREEAWQADNATTAAPTAKTLSARRVFTVCFTKRTPASSHTHG